MSKTVLRFVIKFADILLLATKERDRRISSQLMDWPANKCLKIDILSGTLLALQAREV